MAYDHLPNELVMDIMSRVRGKTLARFRSVSKQFRSLLSDPCFLRLHLNRSRDSLFTLTTLQQINHDPYTIEYNLLVTTKANDLVHEFALIINGRGRMLSSHHQLVCFACETGIHLCDPVNKKFVKLPHPPLYPCDFNRCNKKASPISFGFVDATMQYKIVKWPHNLEEERRRSLPSGLVTVWKKIDLRFAVLNIDIVEGGRLQVSSWRRLQCSCPFLLQPTSQVHVNGFIYWTTSDFQVVSFSLQDETFSILNPKPPCFHRDPQGLQESHLFTLSGSHGILWMIDYDVPSKIMEIWKMEQSQGGSASWAKIHNIDLGGTKPHEKDVRVEMLDIRSDQVLFRLSSLICYDANTNTLLENHSPGMMSKDYQIGHSTDGLLSLHNIDIQGPRTYQIKQLITEFEHGPTKSLRRLE